MENPKDRMDVLKMIEEGRISAAEGARLLGSSGQPVAGSEAGQPEPGQPPRWIRVIETDLDTGKTRVNIRLPVNLLSTGIKMGAHISVDVDGFDAEKINEYIRRGITGKVLEVTDDDEGERVEIYLE